MCVSSWIVTFEMQDFLFVMDSHRGYWLFSESLHYPVGSEICSRRSGGSSSPSSCPFCTCSCTGGSASWRRWRCGTRPEPPDRWPRWSCSPCPPRTASSSGTWCCRCTPSDTARWPARSPGARTGRRRRRRPSRWPPSLGVTRSALGKIRARGYTCNPSIINISLDGTSFFWFIQTFRTLDDRAKQRKRSSFTHDRGRVSSALPLLAALIKPDYYNY